LYAGVLELARPFRPIVRPGTLGFALALFAGFFLYIGATNLLPAAGAHPDAGAAAGFATILGMAMLYAAVRLAQL